MEAAVRLEADRCTDVEAGRSLEWMVTNGRGGYAMASVHQTLTRRYHGLLVAAIEPPLMRYVLLAKLDATALVDGLTYELATNDYPEAVHPQGYKLLQSFSLDPFPTWCFRVGPSVIEQSLCIVPGEDATFVRYRVLESRGPVQLSVRPLCTSRPFHGLTHYAEMGPPTLDPQGDRLEFRWSESRPNWYLSHNGTFRERADWYYQFLLTAEAARGYDHFQDLFMPGTIAATLDPEHELVIAASTQGRSWEGWRPAFQRAAARRESVRLGNGIDDPLATSLSRATEDFIVARADGRRSLLAGYPWFGDWGRDSFIALPGLFLVTGRFEEARGVIETFADHVRDGVIPNRFPDSGEAPEYNTADATLWFIHAIDRILAYTGDWEWVARRMWPVIEEILGCHERGTINGLGVDEDGLLRCGQEGLAPTWMDAVVDGRPVTPRWGKPVEVNALWYNALKIAASFARRMSQPTAERRYGQLASRAEAAFNERFWNPGTGCLNDVVDVCGEAGTADESIRPNQLLAISLTHPILRRDRWGAVVEVCQRRLLTPIGLRTLDPEDRAYHGRYGGDMRSRDEAYHQGTVWPWLMGPFISASLRAHRDEAAVRRARTLLGGLSPHLRQAGLGSVSEVAEGDAPHRPDGCPWQAWSVAEPLRALCEDVLGTHPRSVTERSTSTEPAPSIAGH